MEPARIQLSGKNGRGAFALIDAKDVAIVSGVRWHLNDHGYAVNRGRDSHGVKKTVRMHRLLSDAPTGFDVDHINGDRLDNRRSNLDVCTRSENLLNRRSTVGCWLDKRRGTWQVDVQIDKRKHHFGAYADKFEAMQISYNVRSQVIEARIARS